MCSRMGPDLPAELGELADVVPAHRGQLGGVRAERPLIEALPGQRRAAGDVVGRREHGSRGAEASQHRQRVRGDRCECVVERDRERLVRAGLADRLSERLGRPPALQQSRDLALERLGRHRQGGWPRRADRVVAEHDELAHRIFPRFAGAALPPFTPASTEPSERSTGCAGPAAGTRPSKRTPSCGCTWTPRTPSTVSARPRTPAAGPGGPSPSADGCGDRGRTSWRG